MKRRTFRLIVVFAVALAISPVLSAQEPYKLPPKEVVDIVDAPPTPMVSMSPAGDTMALIERESMPTIAYLAEPILQDRRHAHHPRLQQPPGPELLDRPFAQGHEDGPPAQGRPARRRQVHLPVLVARRTDDRPAALRRGRRRALGGRRRDRSRQGPDARRRQRRPRRPRMGARQPPRHRASRSGRPRPGPGRAARPHRPRGPGLGRQGSQGRDLPGPPQERVRRGPVRLLRHVPAGRRRRRHGRRPQDRERPASSIRSRSPPT